MSLADDVVDQIVEMGQATIDTLMPHFPGKERAQVMRALHQVAFKKRVRRIASIPVEGYGNTGQPRAVYGPVPEPRGWSKALGRPAWRGKRPPNSVFELGSRA